MVSHTQQLLRSPEARDASTSRVTRAQALDMAALVTFLKVVESKSFQDAGRQMGLSRSAVSKRIAQLENSLGVTLLSRNTRRLSVTDAGATFYEKCRDINEALEQAAEAIRGSDARPTGVLRAGIPSGLAAVMIPALLSNLARKWPGLEIDVELRDEVVDVVGGGYDAIVRIDQKLPDSNLYAKRIGLTQRVLVAAPNYLKRHGEPKTPADLKKHRCLDRIGSVNGRTVWSFVENDQFHDVPVSCSLKADNDRALILAACYGGGLLYLPEVLVARELAGEQLRKVLAPYCDRRRLGIFIIHPYKTSPAKVRVFANFAEQCLGEIL